jgi:hypothetical protein
MTFNEKKTIEPSTESKKIKTDSKQNRETRSKLERKKVVLLLSIIIIICIIGAIWIILTPETAQAQLIIESGFVQIKHEGETWISANNGTLLYQSDIVKTGGNSSASIILFQSSIIRLDSNTEIKIKELLAMEGETSVILQQDIGRTWNTISKISGIDNYEVQTPTTVASVRGTSFDVYIFANGSVKISVGNGTVNVTTFKDGEVLHSIEVPEYISVTIDPDKINKTPTPQPYDEDEWILENQQEDNELKEDLRAEIYKRIEPFIPELKNLYNITDYELEVLIDGYIDGYFDLPPDTPEWVRKLFEFS